MVREYFEVVVAKEIFTSPINMDKVVNTNVIANARRFLSTLEIRFFPVMVSNEILSELSHFKDSWG
ncbi:hypothetical protein LA733_1232 [Leptospira interrogans]|uniref:Uncharacterized protein n=7 Tax=Leptospira interrogans TaxID=173 RepID=D4YW04_LEPIN|nr:hypothetical protein LIC_13091 [Leptospira interrogans serovar Copenhageni str. Fiocruz L1-130]ADE44230.1 hypothetical protein LA_3871a [Leptospira interrogans serovar Lai str. 56601]AER03862.1 hypothetical protein LIF_A3093a [Leptospira interrogans serovar Lai str. IPAV]KWV25534.1 hypothetical protein LA733_1232 [Leptospira interrogans]KWV28261.1 hypothetical protein LA702_1032 [Leptospira interrogans]